MENSKTKLAPSAIQIYYKLLYEDDVKAYEHINLENKQAVKTEDGKMAQ